MAISSIAQAQDYLTQFGYLESSIIESFGFARYKAFAMAPSERGAIDNATRHAIISFQEFNGLPQTGELDEDTLRTMEKPRCGFPDVGLFVLAGNKWDKKNISYGFGELTPDIPQLIVKQSIESAFKLWSDSSQLVFNESPSNQLPDILIRFVKASHGDGFAFDGPNNVLAHAFFPPPNGGNLAGDSHFDDDEQWTVSGNGVDLITVAAHEFGHALGLAHSAEKSALMYPYYSGPNRKLGADDIAGIQTLYGSPVTPPPPPPSDPPVNPNPPSDPPINPNPPVNPPPTATGSGIAVIHEPNTTRDYLWTGRRLQWIDNIIIFNDLLEILNQSGTWEVNPETFEWMIQQHLDSGGRWPGR